MDRLGPKGFSLIEALIALAILAMVAVGVLPAFVSHMDANGRNEVRSGAISAAEERLEALRLEDPAAMPETGSSAPQLVTVDGREYEVLTHYCEDTTYCAADSTRQLRVEVMFDGRTIYDVETVFTRLL